jgi:hypothetical protein
VLIQRILLLGWFLICIILPSDCNCCCELAGIGERFHAFDLIALGCGPMRMSGNLFLIVIYEIANGLKHLQILSLILLRISSFLGWILTFT